MTGTPCAPNCLDASARRAGVITYRSRLCHAFEMRATPVSSRPLIEYHRMTASGVTARLVEDADGSIHVEVDPSGSVPSADLRERSRVWVEQYASIPMAVLEH